jgi:hypothetical protein
VSRQAANVARRDLNALVHRTAVRGAVDAIVITPRLHTRCYVTHDRVLSNQAIVVWISCTLPATNS